MGHGNFRLTAASTLISALLLIGCSPGAKMSGGAAKTTATSAKPATSDVKTEIPVVMTPATPTIDPAPVVADPTPSPAPVEEPKITPDDVVDGQEVYKDCKVCFKRATELAATIGFTANKLLTQNLGFYKISAKYGLCDIHFKKNAFDPIQDHEGKDSVLDGQIALYCPCTCNAFNF